MIARIAKLFGLLVGTLLAVPLLLMFVGLFLALGGGIAGAQGVRDFGAAIAGTGALGFVLMLITSEYWGPLLSVESNTGKSNSDKGKKVPAGTADGEPNA